MTDCKINFYDKNVSYQIKDIGVNALSANDFGVIEKAEFFDVRYSVKNKNCDIESILIYYSDSFGLWDIDKIKHEIMEMKIENYIKFEELPLTLQYLTRKLLKSDNGIYFMDVPEPEFMKLPDFDNLSNDCKKLEYSCELLTDDNTPYITVYAGALERINFIDCPELLDRYMEQNKEE